MPHDKFLKKNEKMKPPATIIQINKFSKKVKYTSVRGETRVLKTTLSRLHGHYLVLRRLLNITRIQRDPGFLVRPMY